MAQQKTRTDALDRPVIVAYEQPIGERLRNFLRLEHLFMSINYSTALASQWASRQALAALIEISDLTTRTDVKGELLKELERHYTTFLSHSNHPGVDQNALKDVVQKIDGQLTELKGGGCHPGQRVRQDELVNQVRQRSSIPGGACSFDLPALHCWLFKDHHNRAADLNTWMEDFRIMETGITTVLTDIRQSTTAESASAVGGFFQQQLDANAPCQLIRVLLKGPSEIFPEISGGKHRFTVRFLRQPSSRNRAEQVEETVNFELQCCGI